MNEKAAETESFISEIVRFTLIALIVVFPIRIFIAQPFIVSGSSMDPSFESGEYLIIDELSYKFSEPERGDVIVFKFPQDTSKFFIKRIIGLPGETVVISNGVVRIVNRDNPEGLVLDEPYIKRRSTAEQLVVALEDDEYFVLGDNRIASSDSRSWGPLPEELLVGRALLRLLPINKVDVFPGAYDL